MPWHALSRPSLAIGVLRAACVAGGLPVPLSYHGGLRFAEFLLDKTGGQLTPFEYVAVEETGFSHALGDWVSLMRCTATTSAAQECSITRTAKACRCVR